MPWHLVGVNLTREGLEAQELQKRLASGKLYHGGYMAHGSRRLPHKGCWRIVDVPSGKPSAPFNYGLEIWKNY